MGQLHSLFTAKNQIAAKHTSLFSNKVDTSIGILYKYSNKPISARLKNTCVFGGQLYLCGLAFTYSSKGNISNYTINSTNNTILSTDKNENVTSTFKAVKSWNMVFNTIGAVIFNAFQNNGIEGVYNQQFERKKLSSQVIITATEVDNITGDATFHRSLVKDTKVTTLTHEYLDGEQRKNLFLFSI